MFFRKITCLAAVCLVSLLSVSCLQFGEVSSRIDRKAAAEIETKTVTNERGEKQTLVHASINGSDPGWFMLVSGSYYCILDPRYISRVDNFNKYSQIGIPYPCELPVDIYRSKTLSMGALTIKNLDIAAFDLSEVTRDYDVEIVGMIGFPVFQHSVVKIEYGSDGLDDRVFVYDPDRYELESGEWLPLATQSLQPILPGRVNRTHKASFVVDTGFHGSVVFYSVFVANHDILEGRQTAEVASQTVCGPTTVLKSTVRVFEAAGSTYDNMGIYISTPGSISDVAPGRMAGTIGRDFLDEFDVIFDCRKQRIALINR